MNAQEKKAVLVEIQKIEKEKGGRVEASELIEAAKRKNSPIHGLFQWDDKKAAHEYRLEQARAIIRSVKVNVSTDTRSVSSIAYVRDPDNDSGYVSTLALRDNREAAYRALCAEVDRAEAALRRARDVAESLGLTNEVEQLIQDLIVVRQKVA